MNYIIEDNINFYENLYDDSTDETSEFNNNDTCLITYEPLIENYVTMECGHKFNYIPLFNDIINHKLKYNTLEHYKSGKLKFNEIRCPYCRNKQTTLLPYYEHMGLSKVNGVNYLDPSIVNSNGSIYNKCCYKTVNNKFNDTLPESEENNKYIHCNSVYASPIIGNYISFNNVNSINNCNSYCFYHKKIVIHKYKQESIKTAKLKIKEEKEAAKLKIKEEKIAAKLKTKQEKETAKLKSTKNNETILINP